MQKEIKFAVEEIKRIEFSDYDESEYAIARLGFISTKPNSHGIGISEDVLRASAPSALGKWIVADVRFGDATTHTDDEYIVGIVPQDQEIDFVKDDDGYLRAYADGIISKRYAAEFCDIFSEADNERAVSIEARFEMNDEDNASAFDIKGITALGKTVRPSCPDSDITFVRFSEKEAADCYGKWQHSSSNSALRKFVEERNQSMAEDKKLKVDKSKNAMSETAWGDVDKSAMRDKIMAASNRATLVKAVYMLVEDGWEEAPSEHLKYPVMELKGDTFVYNRDGLSSALGYAKKENETTVVNKIEKIYKKLDLESDGKEEKMEDKNIEMSEVEKTEAVEELAVEMSEPEKQDEDMACGEKLEQEESEKMFEDEMMAKIDQLTKDIEERDHIIMDKDAELEELRKFKEVTMAKETACAVEAVMAEVRPFITEEQFATYRDEGLSCTNDTFDAWSNKVKATCFSEVKKVVKKEDTGVFTFAMPSEHKITKQSEDIWTRLKNQY